VGLVPESLDGAVATTGFAVVRPANKTDAFFLLAVLRHPASTAQLMRCNTGSAYPAIEESVLPQMWIPGAKPETRKSLGARELMRTTLLHTAVDLVNQAKADVEALIEGTLDVQAILAGTLEAPTADGIPELAEVTA
jgi:type I restriction enzyme S subunit